MKGKPRWLRWEEGRQKSGYKKLFLLGSRWLVLFDVYLLKFEVGSEVKAHTDKVDGVRHFRLNIILKAADKGGDFSCLDPLYESPRIKYFRPDKSQHSVSKVEQGSRWVLSIGWIRKKKLKKASKPPAIK